MVRQILNLFVYLLRTVRDDKQRRAFIARIQHPHNLCRGKLENDRVQRFVPAKQQAGNPQHYGVAEKHIVPGVDVQALRYGDRDKIRAAAGGPTQQAEADGKAVDYTAKYTNQQHVVGQRHRWDNIGQHAGQHNHDAGIDGKPFPDQAKTDDSRDRIKQKECEFGKQSAEISDLWC